MHTLSIQNKIYEVRGQRVMLDVDLAALYEVETKVFNQAVKRNIESFPSEFMFQLTRQEHSSLRSQFVTLENESIENEVVNGKNTRGKYSKYLPYAFTEHGVTMLASVLRSDKARKMNIAIVRAFIAMRRTIMQYAEVVKVIDDLKDKITGHDAQLNQIYEALENLLEKKVEEEITKESWENRKRIGFKGGNGQ